MNQKPSKGMGGGDTPSESVLELREEVLQRVETVGSRIRRLSVVTLFVSGLLALSYIAEIILPYLGGSAVQTVNLRNPTLVALEAFLTVMALIWFYVGLSDYRFVARLSYLVAKARVREREIEREITSNRGES
jgi:hypothetical protein